MAKSKLIRRKNLREVREGLQLENMPQDDYESLTMYEAYVTFFQNEFFKNLVRVAESLPRILHGQPFKTMKHRAKECIPVPLSYLRLLDIDTEEVKKHINLRFGTSNEGSKKDNENPSGE
jgi:hypothetical protein